MTFVESSDGESNKEIEEVTASTPMDHYKPSRASSTTTSLDDGKADNNPYVLPEDRNIGAVTGSTYK